MTILPEAAPSAAAVLAELERLTRELEQGLALAGQGKMIKLTGLDAQIAAACAAAQALPPAEAQAMVARLSHLSGLLDRLSAELVHHFAALPPDPDGDIPAHVAADAYGKGGGDRK
jgi:hypothetical protein